MYKKAFAKGIAAASSINESCISAGIKPIAAENEWEALRVAKFQAAMNSIQFISE